MLEFSPLVVRQEVLHAYHLYVIQLKLDRLQANRTQIFAALRAEGIGVNVHYIPVHTQPFYRQHFGYNWGDYPRAEEYYKHALSIPLFPRMSDEDVDRVITSILALGRR